MNWTEILGIIILTLGFLSIVYLFIGIIYLSLKVTSEDIREMTLFFVIGFIICCSPFWPLLLRKELEEMKKQRIKNESK